MDLAGVVVLDLSRVLAGPYASQQLADLGATVWKLEPPRGDDTRGWGPPFAPVPADASGVEPRSAYFLSVNRHKQSLCIDLKDPRGADLVRRLALRADVVLDNFKTGDLARYGLHHQQLRSERPDLITCSITGFGHTGPRAHEPGYDAALQAISGVMAATGEPGRPPVKLPVAWIDVLTGLHAAVGILSALHARNAGGGRGVGPGRHLDIALFDVALASLVNQAQATLLTGAPPQRLGSAHPQIVPYQAFEAADAPFVLACGNDLQFQRVAVVVGEARWGTDVRFASNAARVAHRELLVGELSARFAREPRDTWVTRLMAAGVPATPVLTLTEAFAEPQVAARAMVQTVVDPVAGPIPSVGSPFGAAARPAGPAPRLGEHTMAVLAAELGMAAHELEWLRREGVAGPR
jgi:crotonobetainyl-CoA:carnitine CoA-transferase CaiB-like acyl-CoA transferase